MKKKDSLGDRMKDQYENRTRYLLPRRTYTIIRLDGKAFHTFTRYCEKPYDDILRYAMGEAMLELCSEVQGCKMGYQQSDEISLVLTDFETDATDAWFDGNIQKIASVSASIATMRFNKFVSRYIGQVTWANTNALFDSRVFTIADRIEVINGQRLTA